ncbi:hypothetical protein CHS0354_029211 [Potamilus streckersoni]|uniref:Uncharacterized protein n=1 Tax=Potamilus streckersoni TaxID=2493646 RepID=A0AAE0THI9_9BIVA|nr:hypothetical protein CHS0354_029211 [Potamilus streckersoni]
MDMKKISSVNSKTHTHADSNILNTHEMLLPFWGLYKVRKSRKLVIVILYISMLTGSAFAKPTSRIKSSVDKVIVETSGCQPLSADELREQMGSAFDPNKMSYDGDGQGKRSSDLSVSQKRAKGMNNEDSIDEYYDDSEDEDIDDVTTDDQTVDLSSNKFMRRKRDAEESNVDITNSDHKDSVANSGGFLYQNLLYQTISKRKSRQRRAAKKKFHPAWECKMKTRWKTMKKGYFPTKILDGYCQTDKCFFGVYECNPVKYSIKVMKRDPDDMCKPVPLIGQNTTFIESWLFKRIHVTVACECGLLGKKRKVSEKDLDS